MSWDIVPITAEYYERTDTASAIQQATEMIQEWDHADDPHGYCHVRPMLVKLVDALAAAPDPEAVAGLVDAAHAVEIERQAGSGDGWTSIKSWALDNLRDAVIPVTRPRSFSELLIQYVELAQTDDSQWYWDLSREERKAWDDGIEKIRRMT